MDTVRTNSSGKVETSKRTTHDSVIEIKGSVFTLPVLKILSDDLNQIEKALQQHLAQSLSFFKNAPIVIDLERVRQLKPNLNFKELTKLLRAQKLVPVAVQKGSLEQHLAAESAGLAILTGQSAGAKTSQDNQEEVVLEVGQQTMPKVKTAQAQVSSEVAATRVIMQPIRSGQRIYARGGDLILLAAVNAGAEIMADGNIHIYAPLRGRALAGVNGNEEARIFCQSLEAELVAVAGAYRVFEDTIPTEFHKKTVQIYLQDEQLNIAPL